MCIVLPNQKFERMKNTCFAVLLLSLFSLTLSAQENYPRELGVRFSNIDLNGGGFSLVYKKQKAENKYQRLRATFGNLNISSFGEDNLRSSFSAGGAVGIEKRKPLGNEFYFVRGPEFSAGIGLNFADEDFSGSFSLGAGYVLGLQYNCKKHFFVSLETIPGAGLNLSGNGDNTSVGFNLGFSSAAALTCGWRF